VSRAQASAILAFNFTRVRGMRGKRILFGCAIVVAAAASAAAPRTAAAFGPIGHRLAGLLAESKLCAAGRSEIAALGGGESLAALGVWADTIRGYPEWEQTAPWHFLNVADARPGFEAARAALDAYQSPPEGDVLWAIDRFRAELADRQLPAAARRDALRFLVHFVVDLHQPLHVGRADDRGGNELDVRYGTTVVNLHRFWDTDVLELRGLGIDSYARRLAPAFEAAGRGGAGTPELWAVESLALRGAVYAFARSSGPSPLGEEYLARAQRVAEERLVLSAVRLAATLNEIFCTPTAMDGGSAAIAGARSRPTAMDGGSAAIAGARSRPTAMDGGSAATAGARSRPTASELQ
jgi:nuclease S1